MHVEAALVATAEAIVSVFVVRVVRDHAVVAIFLSLVGHDFGASVGHALADLGHVLWLVGLHVGQALSSLAHIAIVVILTVVLSIERVLLDHLDESLTLTGGGRLIIYVRYKSLSPV